MVDHGPITEETKRTWKREGRAVRHVDGQPEDGVWTVMRPRGSSRKRESAQSDTQNHVTHRKSVVDDRKVQADEFDEAATV